MMWNKKQIENLKFTAIRSLVGEAGEFEISGEGIVSYLEGTSSVTDEQITTEMARIQAEYDSQEYARNRKEEYPEMADQLDMIYWDGVNETTTHKDAIEAIKTKYPKP